MKKIIIAIMLLVAVSMTANAQLILTSDGFVDKNDETKDYVVIEMPGYTQQQLYTLVKTMVTANYVSPKTVLSDNEPVSLCITGAEDVMFSITENRFSYNVVFQFKDGKIKFQPHFISLRTRQGLDAVLFHNGKLRPVMKNVVKQCEDVINDIYLKTTTTEKYDDDNW